MKILFVVHQFYPKHYTGTERFVFNLAATMQKWGHLSHVLTYSLDDADSFEPSAGAMLAKEYFFKGLQVTAVRHRHIPAEVGYAVGTRDEFEWAEGLLKSLRPDLVHFGHAMRTNYIAHAAASLGIPYVVTLTDFWLICPKATMLASTGLPCQGPNGGKTCRELCPELVFVSLAQRLSQGRWFLRRAAGAVAPSRFLAGMYCKEIPFLEPRIIPYGVNYARIRQNTRTYRARAPLNFVYAGQLAAHKGIGLLIDAFMNLRAKNLRLKLYGSGPEEYVSGLKKRASADSRVEFCGVYAEERVGEVLGAADVLVVPSIWHENNTIVMNEALACGVPVIASDVGGITERISDGANGFTFRVGDAQHLHEVLHKVVLKPELLNKLKHEIRQMKIPSAEEEAYAYLQLYESLERRPHAARGTGIGAG